MSEVSAKRNKVSVPRQGQRVTKKTASRVRLKPAPVRLANLMTQYQAAFHDWEGVLAYSEQTVKTQRHAIDRFIVWCDERGLDKPQDITRPILERYQRHLYHYRKFNGAPLSVGGQLNLLLPLQAWFKWMAKQNHILYNPASDLDLPSRPKALPKGLLSTAQVDELLASCDSTTEAGLRLRAMLEVLYSTGVRRFELAKLKLFDVDIERGALMVRLGKGAKDRLVPVGARACAWVDRYLQSVRPQLVLGADDYTLFLADDGVGFTPDQVGTMVKRQMRQVGFSMPGSCHLLRVACATHMLENGADIRFIQSLLGHAKLDTTQIYTQVSLAKLKEVHNATHPAKLTHGPQSAPQTGASAIKAGEPGLDPSATAASLLAALASEEEDREDD